MVNNGSRTGKQLKKLEHFCYLRWQKAQGKRRETELFWNNMHNKIGEMLQKGGDAKQIQNR